MRRWLFTHIDNTGLLLWRMAMGFLLACEGFGAIATGWVRNTMVDPMFTFNFIGFEFLQPLPGPGMYIYFALMGCFGICIMLGYKFRWSMAAYALMWTCVYLMQKSSYNNHYYLMMLLCWVMVFLPAHHNYSIDARQNPSLRSNSMPRWVLVILIAQVWIVYTYASIAKIYPDWLDGTATAMFMAGKVDYWLIGDFLQQDWVHHSMAYFGILYDLLIIPLLLWKRTRVFGLILSVFFHIFNAFVFQIGIFPFMSLAFGFFFFSSEILKKRFLRKKEIYTGNQVSIPKMANLGILVFSIYFVFQIGLPLRHWFIQDDVLWTEEGHRLSWRMMLRTKSGKINYYVVDKATGERKVYKHTELLSSKQQRSIRTKPDMIWQLAQRIKNMEAEQGRDVEVYVKSEVRVNGGLSYPFIDPDVDLGSESWSHLKHHDWILLSPENYHFQEQHLPGETKHTH